MKKLLLLLSLILVITTASISQTIVKANRVKESFVKPQKKDVSIDIGFRPSNGDDTENMKAINLRYFIKDDVAIRFGLNIDYTKTNSDVSNLIKQSSNNVILESSAEMTSSVLLWGFNIGFEKHLKGIAKISPYFGFDFIYNDLSSQMVAAGTYKDNISGSTTLVSVKTVGSTSFAVWKDVLKSNDVQDKLIIENPKDRDYSEIGLNLIAGVNYYVIRNIYLGIEMGFGLKNRWLGDVSAKNYSGESVSGSYNNHGVDEMRDVSLPELSAFKFSNNVSMSIKLGFVL
ncbi:MAG: hypothetical protein WBG43_10750 [Marinifilaceae bacterium]